MKTYLKVCVVILGIITLQSFSQQTPEQDFINKAVTSNRFEIAMAEQAIQKSDNADVQSYAQELVSAHRRILSELEAYAKSKELNLPQEMDREYQNKLDSLAMLGKDRYDQFFKEAVIASHEKSISLFEDASAGSTTGDEAFRKWITDKLPSLRAHLAKARGLKNGDGNKGGMPRVMPKVKDTILPTPNNK